MSEKLLAALALMLVFEGMLPFFSPARWRRLFEQMLQLTDGQVRFMGLASMLVGLLLLVVVGA